MQGAHLFGALADFGDEVGFRNRIQSSGRFVEKEDLQ